MGTLKGSVVRRAADPREIQSPDPLKGSCCGLPREVNLLAGFFEKSRD